MFFIIIVSRNITQLSIYEGSPAFCYLNCAHPPTHARTLKVVKVSKISICKQPLWSDSSSSVFCVYFIIICVFLVVKQLSVKQSSEFVDLFFKPHPCAQMSLKIWKHWSVGNFLCCAPGLWGCSFLRQWRVGTASSSDIFETLVSYGSADVRDHRLKRNLSFNASQRADFGLDLEEPVSVFSCGSTRWRWHAAGASILGEAGHWNRAQPRSRTLKIEFTLGTLLRPSESAPCWYLQRTWPPPLWCTYRAQRWLFIPRRNCCTKACRHGGTRGPEHHVSQQVQPPLLLVLRQLHTGEEAFRQAEGGLVRGLPEEERRVPQRPVRNQPAADRGGADAGHHARRSLRGGRAPAGFRHRPHDPAALLDDVVHPGAHEAQERADREGRERDHMLDQR